MYTFALVRDLRPNGWANLSVLGDAFVLKMASGKNEAGDWYYEDAQPEILNCSLKEQCLETLRSVRPFTFETMVGERGKQPPGKISSGAGLGGMTAWICLNGNLCGTNFFFRGELMRLSAQSIPVSAGPPIRQLASDKVRPRFCNDAGVQSGGTW